MPVKDHPFTKIGASAPAQPLLAVTLTNPHSGISYTIATLIDTGAYDCAFPGNFAILFGHNLKKGTPSTVGGVQDTDAYLHTMIIDVPKVGPITAEINFIPSLNSPLLGVQSFLRYFKLTVDYPREVFSLSLKA